MKSEVIAKASEFSFLGLEEKVESTKRIIQVKWNRPMASWYKLNSGGATQGALEEEE